MELNFARLAPPPRPRVLTLEGRVVAKAARVGLGLGAVAALEPARAAASRAERVLYIYTFQSTKTVCLVEGF